MTRTSFAVLAIAVVSAAVVACSSTTAEPSSSASSTSKCGPTYTTDNTTCSQPDLDAYNACPTEHCSSEIGACKASCTDHTACVEACACGDTTCISKCTPAGDCMTCLQTAAKCVVSSCKAPACLAKKPDGTSSGGSSSGGTSSSGGSSSGGSSSGGSSSGGSSSGGSSSGSTGGACEQLATCCQMIPTSDSDHDVCNYTVSKDVDSTCASELDYYQSVAHKC
jgi:hypothetical protein